MSERPYHHGDLRETLLEAALASIEAHGTEKLSLRALARQAGVSAAAPYRHFPSKRCLLAALMTRGFAALEEAVRRGSAAAEISVAEISVAEISAAEISAAKSAAAESGAAGNGPPGNSAAGDGGAQHAPAARLLGAGMGYLAFAREQPTTYQLMFSPVIGDFSDYEEVKRASESAYAAVLEILETLLALPGAPPLTVSQAGGVVWAAVHGLAALLLFGRDRLDGPSAGTPLQSLADLDRDPRAALELLLAGLTPAPPGGPQAG